MTALLASAPGALPPPPASRVTLCTCQEGALQRRRSPRAPHVARARCTENTTPAAAALRGRQPGVALHAITCIGQGRFQQVARSAATGWHPLLHSPPTWLQGWLGGSGTIPCFQQARLQGGSSPPPLPGPTPCLTGAPAAPGPRRAATQPPWLVALAAAAAPHPQHRVRPLLVLLLLLLLSLLPRLLRLYLLQLGACACRGERRANVWSAAARRGRGGGGGHLFSSLTADWISPSTARRSARGLKGGYICSSDAHPP